MAFTATLPINGALQAAVEKLKPLLLDPYQKLQDQHAERYGDPKRPFKLNLVIDYYRTELDGYNSGGMDITLVLAPADTDLTKPSLWIDRCCSHLRFRLRGYNSCCGLTLLDQFSYVEGSWQDDAFLEFMTVLWEQLWTPRDGRDNTGYLQYIPASINRHVEMVMVGGSQNNNGFSKPIEDLSTVDLNFPLFYTFFKKVSSEVRHTSFGNRNSGNRLHRLDILV